VGGYEAKFCLNLTVDVFLYFRAKKKVGHVTNP
jgi:hypothetical protein